MINCRTHFSQYLLVAYGADAFRLEVPATTACDKVDTLRFIVLIYFQ